MPRTHDEATTHTTPPPEVRRTAAPAFRRVLRKIRRTPERLLHPLRRTRAERLVANVRGPVLVLCHGNICRSPYAEASLRRLLAGAVDVTSAGFIGPGRPAPELAQATAGARGHDLGDHRSRLLTPEMARAAGLAVVMNVPQRAAMARLAPQVPTLVLGDLDPQPIETRAITDPIGRDTACFMQVYDRIDRCAARLAALLGSALPPGSPAAGAQG